MGARCQDRDHTLEQGHCLWCAEAKLAACLEKVAIAWSYSAFPRELWQKFMDGLADEIDLVWASSPTGRARLAPIRAAIMEAKEKS